MPQDNRSSVRAAPRAVAPMCPLPLERAPQVVDFFLIDKQSLFAGHPEIG